ncbi:23S rRNA (guanosine(2251)-2'-O)-methyltransferase RlmB [Paralimibaculum aggregatum]|uniref:23S rRNA (Guanosine(2251)-2'-O)-methyltransferase RlmB n=1 Tax=Paralimibaculum aggregatum TaxID=3036245 RepID=A0ABQ6LJY2_9RHOB|nr:23S rRNA (guanosine(2251)-2'-O)-methyltransferase RlmB [Limibaculum sp. NKW23]
MRGAPRGPGARHGDGPERVWLFGIHAVRDALANPKRRRHRLILTKNAADRLADVLEGAGIEPEIADARRFTAPLDPGSVHQGAAMEVSPLDWGKLETRCLPAAEGPPAVVVALDRVTDPHNVGAVLRSAEVFGAQAVIAPRHHSAPETGALAKTASGALERQPYLRVRNLGDALEELGAMGYSLIGLDGEGDVTLPEAIAGAGSDPVCLVLGAEGPGLRARSRSLCHRIARIDPAGAFGSLNVSNAAAVSLFAARALRGPGKGPSA